MITLPALVAGALIGAGLAVAARLAVAAPQPNLARRHAQLYEPAPLAALGGARARWLTWSLRAVRLTRRDQRALARDLAVCDLTLERHALVKVGLAVGGATMPMLAAAVWRSAGVPVSLGLVAVLSLTLALVGFVLPEALLARRAAQRRRDFRYALSLFTELVVIVLAGGGGVHSALYEAADAGSGWAFVELRRVLHTARRSQQAPWPALAALADRIGSAELAELASSVELAGTSGARVRDSLRSKALTVREHELAEAEAEALAASERMGGPTVAMFCGLILIIGYPAMATVLAL